MFFSGQLIRIPRNLTSLHTKPCPNDTTSQTTNVSPPSMLSQKSATRLRITKMAMMGCLKAWVSWLFVCTYECWETPCRTMGMTTTNHPCTLCSWPMDLSRLLPRQYTNTAHSRAVSYSRVLYHDLIKVGIRLQTTRMLWMGSKTWRFTTLSWSCLV